LYDENPNRFGALDKRFLLEADRKLMALLGFCDKSPRCWLPSFAPHLGVYMVDAPRPGRHDNGAGHLADLAASFSGETIRAIAASECPRRLAHAASSLGLVLPKATVSAWLDALYSALTQHYRCEYVFKNAIANKLLLGRHSPATTTMLFELNAVGRVADVVMLNGTSHVYEIKTDLDSLDRLDAQLAAYRQMFDRVHVVCSESRIGEVHAHLPPWVGLLALTKSQSLSVIREPQSNLESVRPGSIFPTLRKHEYTAAVEKSCGALGFIPTGRVYGICLEKFEALAPRVAHSHMVEQLKRRGIRIGRDQVRAMLPNGMVGAFFASGLARRCWPALTNVLRTKVADFLKFPSD
jgi:hypothetical protein